MEVNNSTSRDSININTPNTLPLTKVSLASMGGDTKNNMKNRPGAELASPFTRGFDSRSETGTAASFTLDEPTDEYTNLRPKMSSMPIMGSVQLSLCGDRVGPNMIANKEYFERFRISFENLCANPSVV